MHLPAGCEAVISVVGRQGLEHQDLEFTQLHREFEFSLDHKDPILINQTKPY